MPAVVAAVLAALLPNAAVAAQVVGCTGATLGSLLDANDPVLTAALQQAFDDTWADAEPVLDSKGEKPVTWPDAKEQGGWVYRCWDSAGAEFTKVVPWPGGNYWKVEQGPELDAGNCALVGSFHSHTGSRAGHPDNDGTPNEKPSDTDEILAGEAGVPGLIIHGHPNDPSSFGVTAYGPAGPADPCPPGNGEDAAQSAGEPHLRTFDGHDYDFQAAGEFALVRSVIDDLEVQARQEPTGSGHVTMNTAIGARVDGATVEVNDSDVVLDGEPIPRGDFTEHTTPGGGRAWSDNGVIRIRWADGSELAFVGRALVIDLADARAGQVEGLLGNDDGDPADDLVDRGGTALLDDGRLTFDEAYERLAPAWAVTDDTSLFTYTEGRSTGDYVIEGVPTFPLTAGMLDPARRAGADTVCREQGVTDPVLVDQCAFDVAATGDEAFAEEAAALAAERERLTTPDATSLVEAASQQRIDEVQRLLGEGAAVNGRSADGRTPLLAAVPTGNEALVQALLAAGADPGPADANGSTALHLAAFWGFDAIATALVGAGADTATEDAQGRTPAEVAVAQGRPGLAEALQ